MERAVAGEGEGEEEQASLEEGAARVANIKGPAAKGSAQGHQDLGVLLLQLLEYYAYFNFGKKGVSVRQKLPGRKSVLA